MSSPVALPVPPTSLECSLVQLKLSHCSGAPSRLGWPWKCHRRWHGLNILKNEFHCLATALHEDGGNRMGSDGTATEEETFSSAWFDTDTLQSVGCGFSSFWCFFQVNKQCRCNCWSIPNRWQGKFIIADSTALSLLATFENLSKAYYKL